MLTSYGFTHNILNILSPLLLFVRFPYHSVIIVWVLCHTSYAVLIQRNPSKASTQRTCTWGFQPVWLFPDCALCWSCGASSVVIGLIPKLRNWNGFHPEKNGCSSFVSSLLLPWQAWLFIRVIPDFRRLPERYYVRCACLIHWKSYYCIYIRVHCICDIVDEG